jgi:hypothetical protein
MTVTNPSEVSIGSGVEGQGRKRPKRNEDVSSPGPYVHYSMNVVGNPTTLKAELEASSIYLSLIKDSIISYSTTSACSGSFELEPKNLQIGSVVGTPTTQAGGRGNA